MILLVRHAKAGSRRDWSGRDHERPLSRAGRRQAEGLVDGLRSYRPTRVLSSPYARCIQTVEPLATATGLDIEVAPELAEGASLDGLTNLIDDVDDRVAVLCSHGDMSPAVLDAFGRPERVRAPYATPANRPWRVSVSTALHGERGGKLGGPPSKARVPPATDSGVVP